MTDTIVALATAPGPAALALVRMSGPGAFGILKRLAPALDPLPEARHATLSEIRDPAQGELLDRALVLIFPRPESYTGEDVVEISTHGGWLAPGLVVEACIAAGARAAEPGEFTRRAYLNGKMDLVQAEAVLDVVGSRNRALHTAALHQLDRGLSRRLAELRERLIHLEALLVHHIDFPEEDEPPVPVDRVVDEAAEVERALERLLETAPEGELLREGALTVLAGRPNSGKSSLFNAMLGVERAIVTEIPGTTRDALEAVVSLEGYPFRLVDTAGVRDAGGTGDSAGRIEGLGIEVARRYLKRADLVLLCIEAAEPSMAAKSPETGRPPAAAAAAAEWEFLRELEGKRVVVVRTKVDLEGASAEGRPGSEESSGPADAANGAIAVSAVTGEGLDTLRRRLTELAFSGLVGSPPEAPVLTRARQTRGVRIALQELRAFSTALRKGVPAEMAATHIRPAETALDSLLGTISEEEVLDQVFREFCIGK